MSVRKAIESGDLNAFRWALDPDVVWIGVYPRQLCRNREDVLSMLDTPPTSTRSVSPELVGERDGMSPWPSTLTRRRGGFPTFIR